MLTNSVVTKALVMRIIFGPGGNLVKANSSGCVSLAGKLTKMASIVTFVSKFMSTLVLMLTSTAKSGSTVTPVRSGYTLTARSKMVMSYLLGSKPKVAMSKSSTSVLLADIRSQVTFLHHPKPTTVSSRILK